MSYDNKRRFNLLSADGHKLGQYTGSSPYQAASKAASKGHTSIMLREHYGDRQYGDKLHVYQGNMQPLTAQDHTAFTMRNGITHKPQVKKMGVIALAKDSVSPAYGAKEDECWNTPAEQCGSKPQCEIHPGNGSCYWPG